MSENSALGAEQGVGEYVALVVEVILAPLRLSTDYSPLLPKQSKIASPGMAYGSGMKNQAIGSRGVFVGRRVGNPDGSNFFCIQVYGEGERPEPTSSVDATIEGEPIELTDDRKSGRCTL